MSSASFCMVFSRATGNKKSEAPRMQVLMVLVLLKDLVCGSVFVNVSC